MTQSKIDPYQPCPCGSGRKYKFCCRAKEQAISNENPLVLIKKSAEFPVCQCVINENWQEQGMANIFVIRQLPNSKFIFGVYLVDVLYLGVKSTFCNVNATHAAIQSMLAQANMSLVPIDYEDARSIIFGGIQYARNLGFEPDSDWKDARHVVEPEKPFTPKFEFGRDGKPFYIPGPDDSPKAIMSTLARLSPP